jgi:hypothetical protein
MKSLRKSSNLSLELDSIVEKHSMEILKRREKMLESLKPLEIKDLLVEKSNNKKKPILLI